MNQRYDDNSESRTLVLDQGIVRDLVSTDLSLREEAASQLPDALSRQEVSDVALQVGLVPAPKEIKAGEKLERELLFYLGSRAIVEKSDLVTAQSSAKELLARWDLAGYLVLTHALRKARKDS